MCVSINTPNGAKRYINEWLKGRRNEGYAKSVLESFQKSKKWLLDHEIRDRKCQPKIVEPAKPALTVIEGGLDQAIERYERFQDLHYSRRAA